MSIFSIRSIDDLLEFLAPPVFEDDEDKTRTARILNTILLGLTALLIVYIVFQFFANTQAIQPIAQITYGIVVVIMIGLGGVLRRGHVKAASIIFIAVGWLAINYVGWNGVGIQGTGYTANIIMIIMASLLLGWQASLVMTALSVAVGFFFVYAANNGLMVYEINPPENYASNYIVVFLAVALIQYLLISTLTSALNKARQSNAELQAFTGSLEQRVADRTRDLNLASEVGRAISQVRDVDQVLLEAVHLIRDRFGLYYVHIAFVDETGRWLRLQSGTGEIGRKLQERAITIAINEKSINGLAVVSKAPVVESDTTASAIFFPHELVPDTKSEISVPLFVGDDVIGVLDLHSNEINGLTQYNVPALETLAAQLVIAMNNARLFNEQEKLTQTLNNERSTLQTVLQSMPAGITVISPQSGEILLTNDRAIEMVGPVVAPDTQVISPEAMSNMYHFGTMDPYAPQDLPLFKAMEGIVSSVDDLEIYHPDTKKRVVLEASGTPIYDQAGNLISAMSIFQDISERKQAEALLNVRIKELDLLSNIGRQIGTNMPVPDFLEWVTQQIPGGMQYPDLTAVAITLDDDIYGALEAVDMPFQMVQGIRIQNELVGQIYIAYHEKHDFLNEESALIGDIGRRISSYIETQRLIEEIASRANELQTVSEVSTAVASTLDAQKLLQDVVDLTKSRFNLYHSHIYLLDPVTRELVLTAGAGEVGRQMVAEGRRIPLGATRSIVARTARERIGIIVNDVSREPNFLRHPLLPNTNSELAVPLSVGEQLLGVLDIQSDEVNHFSEDALQVQMTLAAQIAIALQNATQYEQTQETLNELRSLQSFVTRQGWEAFILNPNRPIQGFRATPDGIRPIPRTDRVTAVDTDYVTPLNVRGTTVGGLAVRGDDANQLSVEDKELLVTISDQIAEALERARLFEETEQARNETQIRAQQEQMLRQIGDRIYGAPDAESVLRTAVRELNKVLGMQTYIYLEDEPQEITQSMTD